MKKIGTAFLIVSIALNANGQALTAPCRVKQNKVCVYSVKHSKSICYSTKHAENFTVCKDERGYYICCEPPAWHNSTFNQLKAQFERESEMTGWYPKGQPESPPVCRAERQKQVCKTVAGKTACYNTKHAYNFNVCKSEYGYYICCQEPGYGNSTYTSYPVAPGDSEDDNETEK